MPERYHIGMKIKESGVALSHIVEIGENLAALSARTGAEYLRLNRGINSVVNIDLREVIAGIDFNTAQMQTAGISIRYPLPGFRSVTAARRLWKVSVSL